MAVGGAPLFRVRERSAFMAVGGAPLFRGLRDPRFFFRNAAPSLSLDELPPIERGFKIKCEKTHFRPQGSGF